MNPIIQQILSSPCGQLNQHLAEQQPVKQKKVEKISVEKTFIQLELERWCKERSYTLETEYRFARPRRWKADWAIAEQMILIEYEGLFSKKSRHTTPTGYTNDVTKYTAAQALGYRIIRLTALNYTTLITEVEKFI